MRSVPITIALALSSIAVAQQIVFVHARVFDGTRMIGRQMVVVDNGVIKSVGPKPKLLDKSATVIDCRGKTLLPGLIDSYGDPKGADAAAVFGVTTFAGGPDWVHIVYDDGFSWGLHRPGASSYEALNDEIDAAHKKHKKVLVEVGSLRESTEAVKSAADGLIRIYGGVQSDPGLPKLMLKKRVFLIPVLTMLEDAGGKSTGDAVAEDPKLGPWLTPEDRVRLKQRVPGKPRMEGGFVTLRELHKAHVPLLAGDGYGNPGTAAGASLHYELELLVRDLGMHPVEALAAATSVPARAFGLDDRGEIAPGKRADLVLVSGDPGRKIRSTRDIEGVWIRGVAVERKMPAPVR